MPKEKENEFLDLHRSNLIIEYKELTESIRDRGREYGIVKSILISGSLLVATFVLRFSSGVISGATRAIASATLLIALILVIFAGIMDWTTRKIDYIFWGRVHKIEQQLGIEQGHEKLYSTIKSKKWYKLRRAI